MATLYIKYAKKNFFFQIIGGAMAPFGQGVATPMASLQINFNCELVEKFICQSTVVTTGYLTEQITECRKTGYKRINHRLTGN